MQFLLLICIVVLCLSSRLVLGQNFRGGVRLGAGGRGRNKPADINANEDPKVLMNAVTIRYPMNIFDGSISHDWRNTATYNQKLVDNSEHDKSWTSLARAQDQEDVWLYENWFYGMENGVIMESGALNGILFSTSFMFEYFANWTAIHVEADPENYNGLRNNRVNAVNVHGALCSEPKLLHYSSVGVLPVRGFIEFMSPSFIKKWHGKIWNNKTRIEDLPTVQCMTVKSLLRELNVKHIDIWILDTEGAEESVLMGTDFNAVTINAIAMECDDHDITKNKRKTDIIEANGFKCQLVERNCMCKNLGYSPRSAPERTKLKKWDGNKWADTYDTKAVV